MRNEKRRLKMKTFGTRLRRLRKRWKLWRRIGSAKSLIFLALTHRLVFMSEIGGNVFVFSRKKLDVHGKRLNTMFL
jgi:hypothetical protein